MTAAETKQAAEGAKLRNADAGARSEAARLMGSVSTEAKAAAARANGAKAPAGPGRNPKPLADYVCTCGAGNAIDGHKTTCPRGQAIRRRMKAGTL